MLCVRADLISTRLLSKDDKNDMVNGQLPLEALVLHVELWKRFDMPDCAQGSLEPYRRRER